MPRRKQPGRGYVVERKGKRGTVYRIRWRVNDGRVREETIGPDRDEAEAALTRRLAEVNLGIHHEQPQASFHVFASEWFAGHRSRLRPSTVERVRNDLEVHLVPFFGDYRVDQIGAGLIERYVAEKVEERKGGEARVAELEAEVNRYNGNGQARVKLRDARRERGLSNVSINKTLTLLRQVLAAAARDGYIARNPVDDVRRLKAAPTTRPFLQLDQVEPLLKVTQAKDRPLLLTLLLAGLRIGEALALRWSDADLLADPPRLTITRTWDPASKLDGAVRRGVEGPVKTGEEGSVTIGRHLLEVLLDHKERSAFSGDDDLVFPTSEGWHQNPANFRTRVLAPAIGRANARLRLEGSPAIPALTPHALRHTYCSLLIAQGEDLSTVAAQMRHADLSTTLRVYAHVMQHRREGVAERLDEALWGGGERGFEWQVSEKRGENDGSKVPRARAPSDEIRSGMRK